MGISFQGTNFLLLLIPISFFLLSFLFKAKSVRLVLRLIAVFTLVAGQPFKLTTNTPQVRYQLDKIAFDRHLNIPEKVTVEEVPFDERMRARELELQAEGKARMGQFKEDM